MKAFALAALTVLAIASAAQAQDMPAGEEAPEPTEAAPEPIEATPLAEEDETTPPPTTVTVGEDRSKTLHHKGQFGAHATVSAGFRSVFPYDKQPCSDDPMEDVCAKRSPATLDLGLTYGVGEGFELIVEARVGLEEEDFIESRSFAIYPGVKIIFDAESTLKFYLATQAIIDSTDHANAGVEDLDLGIRAALGIQVDFIRQFGLYFQGGANLGMRRWFSFLGEAGGGVEVRFP